MPRAVARSSIRSAKASLTPDVRRAISIKTTNIFDPEQTNFVAAVTGSICSTLPAGDVKFAVGG